MTTIEKDGRFYMTLVTIQVENCLFRVPRGSLESQSGVFRDMFSLPVTEDAEGSSDDKPIRLDGIKKVEFVRFLEVLFMSTLEEPAIPANSPVFDMWFPVVKLAQMWACDAIHKHAVRNMPYNQVRKAAVEKVALAVQYDIHSWLIPGLDELAKRKESLGNDDLALLGAELLLKVAAVRESLIAVSNQWGENRPKLASGTRDASTVDFTQVIKRVFQIADDGTKDVFPGIIPLGAGSRGQSDVASLDSESDDDD